MIKHLIIGRVLCPWGVRGQVKVEPLTDDIHRYKGLKSVYLSLSGEMQARNLESTTLLKDKYVVIKFEGIDTRDSAEQIRGAFLEVSREEAIQLPKDRFFISDIFGLEVFDEDGKHIGVIVDILQTKANDVYVIKGEGGQENLIPAIRQVIKDVDLDNNTMIIKPLEGMLEC